MGLIDMNNIQNIYNMLSWESPDKIKAKGFRLAREIKDLSLLIFPPAPSYVWECCAQILSEKSDADLAPYLDKLLEWLQDLNWPGALLILERLKNFSGEKLKKPFLELVNNAIKMNNEEGLKWLDYLSELLDNKELRAILPEETLQILEKHYHNWAWWYEE